LTIEVERVNQTDLFGTFITAPWYKVGEETTEEETSFSSNNSYHHRHHQLISFCSFPSLSLIDDNDYRCCDDGRLDGPEGHAHRSRRSENSLFSFSLSFSIVFCLFRFDDLN